MAAARVDIWPADRVEDNVAGGLAVLRLGQAAVRADGPWRALGPRGAQRLAELTGPFLGAAFGSGLLPAQSTLGIANVPPPSPRP